LRMITSRWRGWRDGEAAVADHHRGHAQRRGRR
jgi:hypothetical protein